MQCLFAADRDLAEVRHQLDSYSPELFRFLKQAADAAGDNMYKVQLCGLLPQMPGVLPVLLGMGFRVFSVAPDSLSRENRKRDQLVSGKSTRSTRLCGESQ